MKKKKQKFKIGQRVVLNDGTSTVATILEYNEEDNTYVISYEIREFVEDCRCEDEIDSI